MPPVVHFDLDGTLSDSAPGILASLRHAFAHFGIAQLDPTTERALLGPPFYESLPPLIGDVALADVIGVYRAHYAAGAMFDTRAYDGVPDMLTALRAGGMRMAVATSKPEHYAVPIIERLGLADFFETVAGDDLDGTLRTKALVIGKALTRLGEPQDAIMVGDRVHDVEGAAAHGLPCLGAAWGYGMPGELTGATHICDTPADVLAVLEDHRAAAR
jgi:phosphoglycolate phosphatase